VTIFHLVGRSDWPADPADSAAYRPASLDEVGFIHFSTAAQLARTANLFYGGRTDLLAVEVDETALTAPLRWEPAAGEPAGAPTAGGEAPGLFPHLYGPIDAAAVRAVHPLPPGPDGTYPTSPAGPVG